MRRGLIACGLVVFALALGCAEPPPAEQPFTARLRAHAAADQPVAGVRFWADGRDLGTTSEEGLLRVELHGREGSAVTLSAACPPAYRTVAKERAVVLRRVSAESGAGAADLELSARCEPLERATALVVLARGPDTAGLPVRVRGEPIGQTDLDGSAHLLVRSPPGAALRIELDTRGRPALRPQNPVHTFRIEEDGVLLVEQAFALAPKRRPPRLRAAPPPRRPERIE